MATLFLTAGVNAMTGAAGAATLSGSQIFFAGVASVVGSYIDSTVIIPRLLGKPSTGDLGSLKLGGIEEGEAKQFGIGPETRMGGFLAWQPRELTVEEGETGKGGVDAAHTKRYASGFYIFCSNPELKPNGVVRISRLWLDSKPRYNDAQVDFVVRSPEYLVRRAPVYWAYQGEPVIIRHDMEIVGITSTAPSFDEFIVGINVNVAQALDPENNGQWKCLAVGRTIDDKPFMRIKNNNAVARNPAHDPGLALPQLVVYQNAPDFDEGLAEGFFFRRGTRSHTVPSDIEAEEGVSSSPAFYYYASVLIRKLDLYDFGNRLPNVEGLVVHDADPVPLQEVIIRLLHWYMGIDPELIDVTGVDPDILVRGYAWKAPFDAQRLLQPLLLAYDIIWYEAEGMAVFKSRQNLDEYTIPESDLGVHQGSRDNKNSKISVLRETKTRKLAACSVRYIDPDSNYQIGEVSFRRPDLVDGEEETINLDNLTLDAETARNIAKRIVFMASDARREVELTLGPKWINLTAGSFVNVTSLGYDWRILLVDVQRGNDDRMICRGVEETGTVDQVPQIGADLGGAAGWDSNTYSAPGTELVVIDMPPIRDEDVNTVRIYIGAAASSASVDWRGAQVYERLPNAPSMVPLAAVPAEAIIGRLVSVMPTGFPHYPNDHDEVDVEIIQAGLFSINEEQQLAGFNMCFIGREAFSFRSAELLVPIPTGSVSGIYRLSGPFLRGLRGTEARIRDYAAGTLLVFVRAQLWYGRNINPAVLGTTFGYKAVASGGHIDNYDEQLVEVRGRTATPFSPSQISGNTQPDAANPANKAVLIKWNRRTRLGSPLFPVGAPPLEEPIERYELIIFQGLSTTVVAQSILNLTEKQWVYSWAQRVAHTNTGSFNVAVRQLGSVVGLGYSNIATLPNLL